MNTGYRQFLMTMVALLAILPAASALAAVPSTVNQQGRLYDVVTAEPIDGERDVTFTLYADATTEEALWSETHRITFDDGYFTAALGSIEGFTDGLFDGSALFVGVKVGDDNEMSPRAKLSSLPYAMLCEDAVGAINPLTVSIPGYGMVIDEQGNWLGKAPGTVMWLDGNGVVSTAATVGIGTSAPEGALHIAQAKNNGYVSMITENVGSHGAEVALKAAGARWNFAVAGSGETKPGDFALQYDREGSKAFTALSVEKLTGNIGFGTTSPTSELVLARKDASGLGPYLLLTGEDGGPSWQTAISLVTHGALSGKDFTPEANAKGWQLLAKGNSHSDSEERNMLGFNFWDGSSYSQNLQLTPNGRVGIGTASPAHTLEVDGVAAASSFRVQDPSNDTTGLIEYSTAATINHDQTTTVGDLLSVAGSRSQALVGIKNAGASGTAPALVIPSGRVGLGTTSPSEKLHVQEGNILGTVMPSNRTAIGLDSNILFNAASRYTVTQTGSPTWDQGRLFDGKMVPSYTDIPPTPTDPLVITIEGLPSVHTQVGAWLGWSTRYWPARRFKIRGYNTYVNANNSEGWRVLADYENQSYEGSHFLTRVDPGGKYTKLEFTFYRAASSTGRLGVSEIFFLHPEAKRPYSGLLPSEMWEGKNGNVGIGTKAPSEKLEVEGALVVGANGAGGDRGTVTHNVAEYFNAERDSESYIHIRLPFDPSESSDMFHIKVQGYAFHDSTAAKIIDLTYVGYAYKTRDSIINTGTLDPTGFFNPTIYRGSDGKVYCRFKPADTYYLTLRVDSMVVGNGRIVNRGEVSVSKSPTVQL